MQRGWMIYGASGYTAGLIAREAVARGEHPVLAGRSREKIEPLAAELGCSSRIFPLDSPEQIAPQLEGMALVLNCAGPFSTTARPMMEACLLAKVHYLDITGEIDVIEAAAALDDRAKQAGICLIPAVGFDVVPSDCLAAMLLAELPSASRLKLAFADDSGISPGTAKTLAEYLPRGGRVRQGGKIVKVPIAWKTMKAPFDDRARSAMTIPWGDVASAWHSTRIGDIEVYTAVPRRAIAWIQRLRGLAPLTGLPPVQWLLKRTIDRRITGPAHDILHGGRAHLWGRVTNAQGQTVSATLETPSAYQLTRLTALLAAQKMLSSPPEAGFSTPSRAFGPRMVLEVPGVDFRIREASTKQENKQP